MEVTWYFAGVSFEYDSDSTGANGGPWESISQIDVLWEYSVKTV